MLFVCRSGPEREAPSDDLIVRQLIPEINPEVNETRIQIDSVLLLLPNFRFSCPTVEQGICVVPLLFMFADTDQLTDILRKLRPTLQQLP